MKGRKGRRGVVRGGKGEWRQSRQIVGINGGWRIMVLEGGHLVARIMQYVVSGWQPQSGLKPRERPNSPLPLPEQYNDNERNANARVELL